jgi:hypothetical protein
VSGRFLGVNGNVLTCGNVDLEERLHEVYTFEKNFLVSGFVEIVCGCDFVLDFFCGWVYNNFRAQGPCAGARIMYFL